MWLWLFGSLQSSKEAAWLTGADVDKLIGDIIRFQVD
jgi:hypothetical protein